jgi:uncharacterized membrane protein
MAPFSPRLLRHAGEIVRGLWLMPLLIALAGVALGIVGPMVDAIPDLHTAMRIGWVRSVFDSSPSGARALLASAAGALATILGVAFSLTLVTLELAAAQYTTRVIARFTDDRVTKIVLGTYIGSVAYLLLVLRAVHDSDGAEFVPRLSLALGVVLVLACLGLLAYFLNHLGSIVQASTIVATVGKGTLATLRAVEDLPGAAASLEEPPGEPAVVPAPTPGYVQIVDTGRLARAAAGRAYLRVDASPGDFLLPGAPLVSLWPSHPVSMEERDGILSAISLGHARTDDQDVLLGVQRLSDVALRALSPSVNDETTAILAVNELGVVALAVARLVSGGGRRRAVRHGDVTVASAPLTLDRILDEGFRGLCRFAGQHPRVLSRVAEVLSTISGQVDGAATASLQRAAGWLEAALAQGGATAEDRDAVERRLGPLRSARRAASPVAAPSPVH